MQVHPVLSKAFTGAVNHNPARMTCVLLNYGFQLHPHKDHHLAVLTPERPRRLPSNSCNGMEVGALWFDGENLRTCTPWLDCIAENA
ncbi:hypothetical protein D3C71_2061410 [compost metagenome]